MNKLPENIKFFSFSELEVGTEFRYCNAIELGLNEVQKKVSDTEIHRIKPVSDYPVIAPDDDQLKVALLKDVPCVQALEPKVKKTKTKKKVSKKKKVDKKVTKT